MTDGEWISNLYKVASTGLGVYVYRCTGTVPNGTGYPTWRTIKRYPEWVPWSLLAEDAIRVVAHLTGVPADHMTAVADHLGDWHVTVAPSEEVAA